MFREIYLAHRAKAPKPKINNFSIYLLKILLLNIIVIDKTGKFHLRVHNYEDERHFHQIFVMPVDYIQLNCDVH
jgi:hypothetical protein